MARRQAHAQREAEGGGTRGVRRDVGGSEIRLTLAVGRRAREEFDAERGARHAAQRAREVGERAQPVCLPMNLYMFLNMEPLFFEI
jgi:hypothetical protein